MAPRGHDSWQCLKTFFFTIQRIFIDHLSAVPDTGTAATNQNIPALKELRACGTQEQGWCDLTRGDWEADTQVTSQVCKRHARRCPRTGLGADFGPGERGRLHIQSEYIFNCPN